MLEYYTVVSIPAGARSIRLLELNASSSYLAIRNIQKKYYLNGRWTIDWPGRHNIAGTVFDYRRPYNRPESLTASGPTNETLLVEVSWCRRRVSRVRLYSRKIATVYHYV